MSTRPTWTIQVANIASGCNHCVCIGVIKHNLIIDSMWLSQFALQYTFDPPNRILYCCVSWQHWMTGHDGTFMSAALQSAAAVPQCAHVVLRKPHTALCKYCGMVRKTLRCFKKCILQDQEETDEAMLQRLMFTSLLMH